MKKTNSKIILGTAQFGMRYGVANKKGKIKYNEIHKILNFLKNNNFNYLDTARAYELSESEIGKYFLKTKKKFNIITKYSFKNNGSIINQFEKTRNNLNYTPSIILAHNYKDYLSEQFHEEIKILKKRYSIKKIGVSLYNVNEIYKVLKFKKPDIVQIPLNIFDKRFLDKKILKLLKNKSIKIFARSIFLQGLLFKDENFLFVNFKNIKKKYLQILKIAKYEKVSLGELSLIWAFNLKQIDNIIVGIDSFEHLKHNLLTLKKQISKKSLLQLKKINLNNNQIINPNLWKIKQ